MGAFNTKAILKGNASHIPAVANRICQEFSADGFEVKREDLLSGGVDISIAKGNLFKAALGLKTALKITLIPTATGIAFEAGVGIFGQQVIPSIIMFFFAWPVLLTQIWGLIQQSKLDDKALAIAQTVLTEKGFGPTSATTCGTLPPPIPENVSSVETLASPAKFCTNCGTKLPDTARFCSNCGCQVQSE